MKMKTIAVAAALFLGACASGPPELQLVDDALEALGGRDRVLAVATLTIEGEGTAGSLGQNLGAAGAIHPNAILGYTQEIDIAQQRMSEQYRSQRQFTFVLPEFGGPVHAVIDGDVAYNVAADGTAGPLRRVRRSAQCARTAMPTSWILRRRRATNSRWRLTVPRSGRGRCRR